MAPTPTDRRKAAQRRRRALEAVILLWLVTTIAGFWRVESLVRENKKRIKEIGLIQGQLIQLAAVRNVALVTVICHEQNKGKATVRQMMTIMLSDPDRSSQQRSAIRRLRAQLTDTDCKEIAKGKTP